MRNKNQRLNQYSEKAIGRSFEKYHRELPESLVVRMRLLMFKPRTSLWQSFSILALLIASPLALLRVRTWIDLTMFPNAELVFHLLTGVLIVLVSGAIVVLSAIEIKQNNSKLAMSVRQKLEEFGLL